MSNSLNILNENIAILISGNGTNMEAIINDCKLDDHPGKIKFVLSNDPNALGLLKAKRLGVKTFVFPIDKKNKLEVFEKNLLNLLKKKKLVWYV